MRYYEYSSTSSTTYTYKNEPWKLGIDTNTIVDAIKPKSNEAKQMEKFKSKFNSLLRFIYPDNVLVVGKEFVLKDTYFRKFLTMFRNSCNLKTFRKTKPINDVLKRYTAIMFIEPYKIFNNEFELKSFIIFLYKWFIEGFNDMCNIISVYLDDDNKGLNMPKHVPIERSDLNFNVGKESAKLEFIRLIA